MKKPAWAMVKWKREEKQEKGEEKNELLWQTHRLNWIIIPLSLAWPEQGRPVSPSIRYQTLNHLCFTLWDGVCVCVQRNITGSIYFQSVYIICSTQK